MVVPAAVAMEAEVVKGEGEVALGVRSHSDHLFMRGERAAPGAPLPEEPAAGRGAPVHLHP